MHFLLCGLAEVQGREILTLGNVPNVFVITNHLGIRKVLEFQRVRVKMPLFKCEIMFHTSTSLPSAVSLFALLQNASTHPASMD